MAIEIRFAEPKDAPVLADFLLEVDRYYAEASETAADKIPQIQQALFGDSSARAILAWKQGELVGFAAYSFLWPAAQTSRSLYLKELYVSERHRRNGIGRLLMKELTAVAQSNECCRIEWTADTAGIGAQDFYESLGAPKITSKIFYRLEATSFASWPPDVA